MRHFALLEATLALATILRDIEIRTSGDRIALDPRITLHPAGAVPAELTPATKVSPSIP